MSRGLSPLKVRAGTTVQDHYWVERVIAQWAEGCAMVATDLRTAETVGLLELSPLVAASLRKAVGVHHPNLCRVRDVEQLPHGMRLVVHEWQEGSTLQDVLASGQAPTMVEATRCAVALADALVTLHDRGACHGMVAPRSVRFGPGGLDDPMLAFAVSAAGPDPYRCPERGLGAPSVADDVWAVAGMLHHCLAGSPPAVARVPQPG